MIDDKKAESCNFFLLGSGFVVQFLSLNEHCSLNKYLNSVALTVVGNPSLFGERCLELAMKVAKDSFH